MFEKKLLIIISLIIVAIPATLFIPAFIFIIILGFTLDWTSYDKQDLINNYELKYKEISELRTYINSIIPENTYVDIEFDNNKALGIFHISQNDIYSSNWDIDISSQKTDSLLNVLKWDRETLKVLKSKLDKANCISVESGEPCTIGFQRSGMGKYYYKVFSSTLTDSLIKAYNDKCRYIYYKNNIVLEYGGGAFGNQCFMD